jgi:PAS domain S-box-containing protein
MVEQHGGEGASPATAIDIAKRFLRGSPGAFDAVWEAAADAMAISDPDGLVLLANPAYYALYGYTPDEVLGHSFAVIFPEAERAGAQAAYRDIFLAPAESASFDSVVRRTDGDVRIVEARYTFLMDGSERRALLSIVRDITERKQLEARLQAEVELLETLDNASAIVSAELELTRVIQAVTDAGMVLSSAQFGAFFRNTAGANSAGYTLCAVSGAPREAFAAFLLPRATALFGPTFRGEHVVRLDDLATDPAYGQQSPYHGPPPGQLPVRSLLGVAVTSRSGDVIGGLFFGHAEPGIFTARHERLIMGLANRAAVAIDNAQLYEEARQALRIRDSFLATAAHELRTPLTALKGYAQLISLQLHGPVLNRERVDRQFARLRDQINHLETLVGDLLDVGQLQQGRLALRRERVDLVAIGREVLAQFALAPERTPRHRLLLEEDGPLWAQVDPHRWNRF